MAVTTGLYPPIVMDTAPAFVRNKTCKFYFSLSTYNSATDILNVQVSLVNQRTNASAFRTDLYPSGIKIADLNYDPEATGDYKYYILISPFDLVEGQFGLNQFYKVQLRFTSKSIPSSPDLDGQASAKWLYQYMKFFSQWSKVCLIKGIGQPIVSIRGFSNEGDNQETVLTTPLVEIIGQLTYSDEDTQEQEYLKSYSIKLYQENNSKALIQSGEIYTNPHNPNEFNYQLAYDLLDGTNYILSLTYTTNNSFTETINYNFTILSGYEVEKINADIIATPDEENGKIRIDIKAKDTEKFIGNLTIRRTSSESGFHKWEDVKTIAYTTGAELNYTWYDTTIQSGIWYKYCAQRRNSLGDRGTIIQIEKPVMCLLDDIFLTREDCQLKIKFNPSLNEFKYNVTESQQVTIGAKYPYIKRNGNNYFRTFPIGGLISSFVDTTDWYDPHFYNGEFHNDENEIKNFTSKVEIYGEGGEGTPFNLYNEYNDENGITEYNDYIYERQFRKKVYDFLYAHNVKLFRSTTEGNILVKLMNIDFQPVESLGRRLYSFTATAVQVDDATISNYNKYGIQTIGEFEKYIIYTHEVLGQITKEFPANVNILNSEIDARYKKSSNKGFINQVQSLKWLKLEIETPPYVIIEQNGQLIKATKTSQIKAADATSGHIVQINGTDIIVYPHIVRRTTNLPDQKKSNRIPTEQITYIGIFELKENNTLITDLRFKYPTTATINYIANLEEIEDTSNIASRFYYYYKPGQLYGTFEPQESLIKKIYNKYLLNYNKYYQKLLYVTDIKLEGLPGTVVYVKDSQDTKFQRHILANGQLQLREDETTIEGLYFCGIHMYECPDPLEINTINGLIAEDFILQDGLYNTLSEIENPINGGIYCLRSQGIKSGAFLENHRILVVNESSLERTQVTPDNYYTLILDTIEDDENAQFVYYYGCWYVLPKGREKASSLLPGDIRHIRENEFIEINTPYDSLEDIKNPITNGVYWVPSYMIEGIQFNTNTGKLTVEEDYVYKKIDQDYELFLQQLFEDSRYIYYHNEWYVFTKDHDVLCPINGIVDYYCEIIKGVY